MKSKISLITLAIPTLYTIYLSYQHLTTGVDSHHFLANPDYPTISNWFGLPILALLSYLFYKKSIHQSDERRYLNEFFIAIIYGMVIYIGFKNGLEIVTGVMFLGLFIIGLFYPIYKINIYFGIVLGMTYGFGAVLPSIMIGLACLTSFLTSKIYNFISK
jgi:hypothetical protein